MLPSLFVGKFSISIQKLSNTKRRVANAQATRNSIIPYPAKFVKSFLKKILHKFFPKILRFFVHFDEEKSLTSPLGCGIIVLFLREGGCPLKKLF